MAIIKCDNCQKEVPVGEKFIDYMRLNHPQLCVDCPYCANGLSGNIGDKFKLTKGKIEEIRNEIKPINICSLVRETVKLTNDDQIIVNLLLIKRMAEKMEDRLLKYCNAIEDLGFVRTGRDYEKQ